MNFLAHSLLAARSTEDHDHDLVAGGVLGDFWKGSIPTDWPLHLQLGVRLHRRIDAISNLHPAVRRSCDRFPPAIRRFAPILVDIHADLALASCWDDHHSLGLNEFSAACYRSLDRLRDRFDDTPPGLRRFIDYLEESDLLPRYGTWEGVNLCIDGIARRLRKPEFSLEAMTTCIALSDALTADFLAYFPDLLAESSAWVSAARSGVASHAP